MRDSGWGDWGLQFTGTITRNTPRLGFRRKGSLAFLSADGEDEAFAQAVAWMRDRLDRLVSTLHPHLQSMIAATR